MLFKIKNYVLDNDLFIDILSSLLALGTCILLFAIVAMGYYLYNL